MHELWIVNSVHHEKRKHSFMNLYAKINLCQLFFIVFSFFILDHITDIREDFTCASIITLN